MAEQQLPERSAPPAESAPTAETAAPAGSAAPEAAGPSKNALKKLQKEKEKAEKKKAAQAAQQAQAAAKAQADAEDVSKAHYGETAIVGSQGWTPIPKTHKLAELSKVEDGTQVVIRATVSNSRAQGTKLAFLNLRRGYDSIQAVVAAADGVLSKQMVKFAGSITSESIVDCVGVVKQSPEPIKSASITTHELHIKQLWVISKAAAQLPIQVSDCERAVPSEKTGEVQKEGDRVSVSQSTRLDNRVLDLRSNLSSAIFEVSGGIEKLFVEYLDKHGFLSVKSPKILGAPSEGGASVFTVQYFDRTAALAQSPQLYKQQLIAAGKERVYEVAPVFRAENSNTSRHLTEYVSLDLEMAFDDDYSEVLEFIRDLLIYILQSLETRYARQIEIVRKEYRIEKFLTPKGPEDVPILTFAEGAELLKAAGLELSEPDDINSTEEKRLGDLIREKYKTDFFILKEYPTSGRPFYSMVNPNNPDVTNSFDFIMRGMEVLSGAHRVNNHEMLVERIKEKGMDPNQAGLRDYVQAFSYGCPPHGGGAFGLERLVANYLGLPNIRLASLFPRDPIRLTP